jgi:hydroxymethylpyrimidine pyrophosphatase-like HAD family hydrolase
LADVDGTLVTRDKVLTEATVAAAAELHDAGLALAITSGRPHAARACLSNFAQSKLGTALIP